MLKPRTLAAFALLAAVVTALLLQRAQTDPHAPSAQPVAPPLTGAFPPADAERLTVAEPGKPDVVLEQQAGVWRIVQPVADRADQKNVEGTLAMLAKLERRQTIAVSASSHQKLGVDDAQALRVSWSKGAAQVTLRFAKSGHVRAGDAPEVVATTGFNRYAVAREPKMWRDRELIRFEQDALARLEVVHADGTRLVAMREPPVRVAPATDSVPRPPSAPEKWRLIEGAPLVGGLLDEGVPAGILSQLHRLDAADFSDGLSLTDAGLVPPRVRVVAVLTDGSTKELLLGRADGAEVLAARAGDPRVYKLRKATVDKMLAAPLQWRDKQLARIETSTVSRLELVRGAKGAAAGALFSRVDAKTWQALAPVGLDVDSARVQALATAFGNLRALAVVTAVTPEQAGLIAPEARVIVTHAAGVLTLEVGSTVPRGTGSAAAAEERYVRVSGREEIFTLPASTAGRFLKVASELAKSAPAAQPHSLPPGMHPPSTHVGR